MPESRSDASSWIRRLRAMGLEARPLPGGRAALATLRLSPRPFPSPRGGLRFERLTFATVGSEHVKCLRPLPLFHLPLVSVRGCSTATALEASVREAWERHLAKVGRAEEWLRGLGVETEPLPGGAGLRFPLGLDDPEAQGLATEKGRVVLPGRGPLSGIPLTRAGDRVFAPAGGLESAVDLEIAVTTRLEELARAGEERARRRRLVAVAPRRSSPNLLQRRRHAVLLVGRRVARDRALVESLRLRGHVVSGVLSVREALEAFAKRSFGLVLSDAALDRAEGIELVPLLRDLPGVASVPVVVVDDRLRPSRRETARKLGAAGYLVHPVDVSRVERRLAKLLDAPGRRRFVRYARALPVRWEDGRRRGHASAIGRGGMCLQADWDVPLHAVDRFEIGLPESHQRVQVDAEVVNVGRSVGLRFHAFPNRDEGTLIRYLELLDARS